MNGIYKTEKLGLGFVKADRGSTDRAGYVLVDIG